MSDHEINFDLVFSREGRKPLYRITTHAQELLDQAPLYYSASDLVEFVAKDIGPVKAFEFVYGKPVPDLSDKEAMLELARERVEAGYGYRYASVISGLSESWLRSVLDPDAHEAKKTRDREYHERVKEHRKVVRRKWYLAHREEHKERQRRKKK